MVALLSTLIGNSQLLDNTQGIELFDHLMFNKKTLKKKRVRSIQTRFMIKKELRPIAKKPQLTTYYEYNNDGELILFYKTFLLFDTNYDTLVEFYTYQNSRLLTKRKTEFGKIGVYNYDYNTSGLVKKVTKGREINLSNNKLIHIPQNYKEVGEENFHYQFIDDKSFVKYTLSVDSVRYKEQEVLYEKGKLIKDQTRLLYGQQKYEIYKYSYFEKDLVKKEVVDNYSSAVKKYFIYRYYSNKNLSSIETYNNKNEHIYTTEFLYKNDLLDAILKKDERSKTIEITKYKYEFY